MSINYIKINRDSWNNKTEYHVKSAFYDVERFLDGESSIQDIELNLMGDVRGKSLLHLQCHFGQDTISLERLGAKVTGVDLSDKSIEIARQLAESTESAASFICCNIYDLPSYLNESFDIVFTSYGTIGWLPDLNKWAEIIARFLKPGGQFIFVEFHPVVWMFDDNFENLVYNYFNTGPILETHSVTYADREADLTQEYVMWNHGISEVINSLIKNGIELELFNEYDYSPYDCFSNTIEFEPGKFRIKHMHNKIPMVYAIAGRKKLIDQKVHNALRLV